MTSLSRVKIPGYWIANYILRASENASHLFILLHGYTESGSKIYERLIGYLPSDAIVLAPCGPFPLPQRKAGDTSRTEHEIGYSWYFYDFRTDQYIVDMDLALTYLFELVSRLKLTHLPITIIGFSQGGYLAPFLGLRLPQTEQVIGIASRFLEDELPETPHFQMDAVHGEMDEVIECSASRESHRRLLQRGVQGTFVAVPGTAHRLTFKMRSEVANLLKRPAKVSS